MLIDAIVSLLGGSSRGSGDHAHAARPGGASPPDRAGSRPVDPVHLAACALLLEIAWADDEFSAEERAHLEDVLERHFDLPPAAGRRLMELAEAERQEAIDTHRFTSVVKDNWSMGQKMVLAEVMWGLVLADGQIAAHEAYLTRKIANLLGLKPGFLASARKAVEERTGEAGAPEDGGIDLSG